MLSFAWMVFAAQLVVGPGTYRPLFAVGPGEREIAVPAFRIDRTPVTNADFLAFVKQHPGWRRDRVAPFVADEQYLARWQAPDALGPAVDPRQPVVDVSWFAARAYCAARGARLPTEAQWELAEAPSHTKPDALFEWVLDFDAASLAGRDGADVLQTCAAGAAASGDKSDFAAFERFAMRSALRARYTTHDLGFRCAAPVHGDARKTDGEPPLSVADAEAGALYALRPVLRDQEGQSIGLDVFRGHPVILSMFYGSCPSACPVLVSNVARLDAKLPEDVRAQMRVLLVSFDAVHDTPDALRGVAAAHHLDPARWTLAAASDDDARELAEALGISYRALPGGGFAHSSVITALDREGRPVARAEGPDADLSAIAQALAQAAR